VTVQELIEALSEFKFTADRVDLLINGKKFLTTQVYLEDYSDGTYKIVIEGKDK